MIKIFPTIQIKELDAYTIENEPVASIDLMERASQALAKTISERWNTETPFTVFAGPGNNGGDALAVSRLLAQQGYRVEVYLFNTKGSLSPDCETNKKRLTELSGIDFHEITTQFVPPELTARHVVLDGLFGSGLNKPLSGGFAAVVKYINSSPATVVALDVPSGLMGEDNTYNIQANIIRADLTLSLQLPKLAFLFAENEQFVGEWQLLDIGLSEEAINEKETDFALTEHGDMPPMLKVRSKFAYKGNFGRALLIAGSQGMAGASVLAARACLRSGIGLLTVHIPFCNNFIVQTSVPEAMTEIDINDVRFSCATDTDDYQAVGIGPGLGKAGDTEAALLEQIESCQTPMVVDADALNLLAFNPDKRHNRVLTPHPGEAARLLEQHVEFILDEPLDALSRLHDLCGCCVLLKGARTLVSDGDATYISLYGTPALAKGGSGDVLSGILTALLCQRNRLSTSLSTSVLAAYGVLIHALAGLRAEKRFGANCSTPQALIDAIRLDDKEL